MTHRLNAITSFKKRDYDSVRAAIVSILGLLPEEYKVTISTEAYQREMASVELIFCPYCAENPPKKCPVCGKDSESEGCGHSIHPRLSDVEFHRVYNSPVQQFVLESAYSVVWTCPNCNSTHRKDA